MAMVLLLDHSVLEVNFELPDLLEVVLVEPVVTERP